MEPPLETLPLQSPEQLLRWAPPPGTDARRASAPLCAPRPAGPAGRPRVLATHDMRGNYKDDRFVQGARDPNFYADPRWSSVDVFVYFSHHLVVIPPVGWIDAAHRNGTQVLGTLMTEGSAGSDACSALLRTPETAAQAAVQLARIAAHFGFEGWLINVENDLSVDQVQILLAFLRKLRAELAARVRHPFLVWYDAVTAQGDLYWQNTVNSLNRPFFDACDAIFVNYTWKSHTPRQARSEAGERHPDVFMGVDVFGRGTFGGGGLCSGLAIEAAANKGLSSALFAIGWPFESSSAADQSSGRWRIANAKFWDSIPHSRPTLTSFPFATAFCPGVGTKVHQRGRLVHRGGWYHLGMQSPLPVCLHDGPHGALSAHLDGRAVYSGSSSLLVRSSGDRWRPLLLFRGAARAGEDAVAELRLRIVYAATCNASVILSWNLASGRSVAVKTALPRSLGAGAGPPPASPWCASAAPAFGGLPASGDAVLAGISVHLEDPGELWIGLLAVGDAASFAAPQAPSELRADVLTWRRENSPITGPVAVLDADVRWCDAALPPPAVRASRWHIWANWGGGVTWLGVAHQPVFGVRGLRLPGECVRVRFYVQPESWDGETFSRRGSPSVAVAFPSPL